MAMGPGKTRRKQFAIDDAVLTALESLSRDGGSPLDKLADEALRDLLKKYRRPLSLKQALQQSAREQPANDPDRRPSEPKASLKRSSRKPAR